MHPLEFPHAICFHIVVVISFAVAPAPTKRENVTPFTREAAVPVGAVTAIGMGISEWSRVERGTDSKY